MVAILQRSGVDEAGNSRQYSPFLWGIDRGLRLLSCIFLVRKGNIMDYLTENRDINRYYLVSTFQGPYALGAYLESHEQLLGAANGLRFLHESGLIHGALRPVCVTLF
jgi:hypothetical protein